MLSPSFVRKIGLTFAAITQMAITVVLGIFLGGWLDSLHSLGPLFLFSLSLGALVFGMTRLTRTLNQINQDER